MKTLVLLDGEHVLSPPTFFSLTLMEDFGVDLLSGAVTAKTIPAVLAAILTDSEPLIDGEPSKMWTPTMAAKLLRPSDMESVMGVVTDLLAEAFPEGKGESGRPTSAQAG